MITDNDKKELLKVLEEVFKDARRCLENDNVIPESISQSNDTVGVSIKFRKIYEKRGLENDE